MASAFAMPPSDTVDPYCVACGALVGWEELFGARLNHACDRETPDPESQVVWGSIYRAVFRPTEHSFYRLSGIGRYDYYYRNDLVPPWNRDGNTSDAGSGLGRRSNNRTIHSANFIREDGQHQYPHGFLIHANCWTLIERIIGPKAEEKLELFVEVLRRRWKEHPFEIDLYRESEFHHEPLIEGPYWAGPDCYLVEGLDYVNFELGSHCEFGPSPLSPFNRLVSDLTTRDTICLRDPIKIPKLHDLVRRCVHDYAREETKRKTRNWHLPDNSIDHLIPGGLPLDLKLCILDFLDGKGIRNALLAFGWKVPQFYFEARCPRRLIFEVDDLGPEINWKRLFFGVEYLLETSSELGNRQRIFKILEGTKELFAAMGGFNDGNED